MINKHAIIIESGATKTEWVVLDSLNHEIFRHVNSGINANYCSDIEIITAIRDFNNATNLCSVNTIYSLVYYGAGCGNATGCERVKNIFANTFAQANIAVYSDLMAACHALCGLNPGIVAILGTGSSSCLYNGSEIVDKAPSLGYLLGDEGSGTFLGKLLIVKILKSKIDKAIVADFEKNFCIKKEQLIPMLYQIKDPNLWLASLAPFIAKYSDNKEIKNICLSAFDQFFRNDILYYPDYKAYKLYCLGSIAYYFRSEIESIAAQYEISLSQIIPAPMDKLVDFYANRK